MTDEKKGIVMDDKILNVMMSAIEYGYRACEKGHNLQMTMEMASKMFSDISDKPGSEVKP